MDQFILKQIWEILHDGFVQIVQLITATVPELRATHVGFHNDRFIYFSSSQIVSGERSVTLAFNLQGSNNKFEIFGEIMMTESGEVLKEVTRLLLNDEGQIEAAILDQAILFQLGCKENLDIIVKGLG